MTSIFEIGWFMDKFCPLSVYCEDCYFYDIDSKPMCCRLWNIREHIYD